MKFSIGIPAYKAEYLAECIISILNQTYTDFELIIVNDASPQRLDEIVAQFEDDRILYYKNEQNCGALKVVDNWNICLSYASGEYFICMGDDDKLAPNYLEEFNHLIDKYPDKGVYHTRTLIINEQSEPIMITESRYENESVLELIWRSMNGGCVQFISDFVYNTGLLRKNGGFFKLPLAWGSDYVSAFIAASKNGIAHTNNPVFMYRMSSQTISSSGKTFVKLNAVNLRNEWLSEFVNSLHPITKTDIILKQMIKKHFKKYHIMSVVYELTGEMQQTGISCVWQCLLLRKKYGLSLKLIVYSYLQSLKHTYSKK